MTREAERKRLIELFKEMYPKTRYFPMEECQAMMADYLLDNGIVVPPCKVGDEVYLVGAITRQNVSAEVVAISTSGNDFYLILENGTWLSYNQHIGKTVFLNESQAEEALKNEQEKL